MNKVRNKSGDKGRSSSDLMQAVITHTHTPLLSQNNPDGKRHTHLCHHVEASSFTHTHTHTLRADRARRGR